jgi:hypothetical protein
VELGEMLLPVVAAVAVAKLLLARQRLTQLSTILWLWD